jgi:hypothetical protein
LGTRQDLPNEEIRAHIRDPSEQSLALLWILVQPSLALFERLAPAAFDHVRHQSPRRSTEPDERYPPIQSFPGKSHRLKHVSQLLLDIDGVPQSGEVARINERLGQHRSLGGFHEHRHPQGLGHDEDVAEDDGSVERRVSVNRLESELRGNRRRLAAFEERVVFPDLHEF